MPEIIIVTGIVTLIAGMAMVGFVRHRQNAEDQKMQAELGSIYKAMQSYRLVYGRYPISSRELREFISIPDFDQRYEINLNPGG